MEQRTAFVGNGDTVGDVIGNNDMDGDKLMVNVIVHFMTLWER